MTYLDKLLEGVEVEWIILGDNNFVEIANNKRKPVKASLRVSGKTPYYGANNIQDYVEGFTHIGEYVLIAEDGTVDLENYSIQYATGKFWANNHVHVIRGGAHLDTRFMYHYLQRVNFIPFLSGGGRAKLTKAKLQEIKIPIPPLEIQQKIVGILDNFTMLTAELTAELTSRIKQYEFYREKLLSFEEGEVEWKTLGEIAKIQRGIRLVKSQLTQNDKYPVYQNSMIPLGYYDKSNVSANTVFLIGAGSAGEVGFSFVDFWAADDCYYFECSQVLNSRYLYYALLCQQRFINSQVRRSSIPRLSRSVLDKMIIPIPPLEEQARIVSILDKFDTLTTSISEGLPKEIELRKKQYEHYREMLLSFPKAD